MRAHRDPVSRRPAVRAVLAALALLLSLPAAGLRPARADIPGVVYNPANGHYYKWILGLTTWANAKTGAETLGGYLVTVTSSAEQAWLAQNIIPGGMTSCLGGTDETAENTWVWITGETWSYTYWNGGEPNNSGNEDYLAWNSNTTWNDIVGTSGGTSGYVVEWNADPNIPPPPADPTGLTAVLLGNGHVQLDWVDNATNEVSFDVERKADASAYSNIATPPADSITYDDAGVIGPATFTYRVRASNSGGKSGWTNEASVLVPEQPSAPAAPSDLHSVASGTTSVTIQWTDNSDDETSFELQRRNAAGSWPHLASPGADVTQHVHSGLLPDTTYSYRVRAVNGVGASSFAEGAATTAPTMTVTTVKADLKDTGKFAKDSVKVQATFDFLEDSDGTFDPVVEGITVRAGTASSPVTLIVPPNDVWKVKGARATWKSPGGSTPKYKVEVRSDERLVKLSVTAVDLAVPAANPMRVSIVLGDDAGTEQIDWPVKKSGIFQFR
jgi:hypothetical protein